MNAAPRNQAPLVSNGLFGGAALKEDDPQPLKSGGAGKLNSIFDYEEEEEEVKAPVPQQQQKQQPLGFGSKGGGLFNVEDDDDMDFMPKAKAGGYQPQKSIAGFLD